MKTSILAAAVLCTVGGIAQAQTYPAKTVRIIVPFAPGGGSDFIARTIAQDGLEPAGTLRGPFVSASFPHLQRR